jgi:hypothetical protein
MKKTILSAVLVASITAGAWSIQAQTTYNGDLIIGFTGGGSASDFEYDLGSAASLTSGQTWNLGGSLGGFNLANTSWGVVGSIFPAGGIRTGYITANTGTTPNRILSSANWSAINNADSTIYSLFPAAGAGNSTTVNQSDPASWNQQTINGSGTTTFHNAWQDPNHFPAGTGSMDFFSALANNTAPNLLGTFSLDGAGTITFTAVPEPGSYGLVAGLGLLAFCIRRSILRKA